MPLHWEGLSLFRVTASNRKFDQTLFLPEVFAFSGAGGRL